MQQNKTQLDTTQQTQLNGTKPREVNVTQPGATKHHEAQQNTK